MLKPLDRPVVAVIGDSVVVGRNRRQIQADHAILLALIDLCDVQPVILPPLILESSRAMGSGLSHLRQSIDGVCLACRHDQPRQDTEDRPSMLASQLPAVINAGIPFLAVGRGMQEWNIALGGDVMTQVSDQPGRLHHRWFDGYEDEDNYAPRHSLKIQPDGLLAQILSPSHMYLVNSLHQDAVNRLASGMRLEAVAEDNTIEAISWTNAPNFALGVQWHPEWIKVRDMVPNKPIFTAFSQAVFAYHQKRIQGHVG